MSEELKEELEVAFTAVWTESLVQQAGKDGLSLESRSSTPQQETLTQKGYRHNYKCRKMSSQSRSKIGLMLKQTSVPCIKKCCTPQQSYEPPVFAQINPSHRQAILEPFHLRQRR